MTEDIALEKMAGSEAEGRTLRAGRVTLDHSAANIVDATTVEMRQSATLVAEAEERGSAGEGEGDPVGLHGGKQTTLWHKI